MVTLLFRFVCVCVTDGWKDDVNFIPLHTYMLYV